MKGKDAKPGAYPIRGFRALPMGLTFVVLCGFSFYLGGIYCSEKNKFTTTKVEVSSAQSRKDTAISPLQIKPLAFPECGIDYQDYTPCTDPKVVNVLLHLILCCFCKCMKITVFGSFCQYLKIKFNVFINCMFGGNRNSQVPRIIEFEIFKKNEIQISCLFSYIHNSIPFFNSTKNYSQTQIK